MSHKWQVGDPYTILKTGSLNIIGRITKVTATAVHGAEIWFNTDRRPMEFHVDCIRYTTDMVLLGPVQVTIEAQCMNGPDCDKPPCPEHRPVDAWKDGLPTDTENNLAVAERSRK